MVSIPDKEFRRLIRALELNAQSQARLTTAVHQLLAINQDLLETTLDEQEEERGISFLDGDTLED